MHCQVVLDAKLLQSSMVHSANMTGKKRLIRKALDNHAAKASAMLTNCGARSQSDAWHARHKLDFVNPCLQSVNQSTQKHPVGHTPCTSAHNFVPKASLPKIPEISCLSTPDWVYSGIFLLIYLDIAYVVASGRPTWSCIWTPLAECC